MRIFSLCFFKHFALNIAVLSNKFYNLSDYSIEREKNNILLFILFPVTFSFIMHSPDPRNGTL